MKKSKLENYLRQFESDHKVNSKGSLSVTLVITRAASRQKAPYKPEDFLTPKGGQVSGLSGSAVQAILADHDITRILAEEGGRTSRGSINLMQDYLDLLNELYKRDLLDFTAIECWWVDGVKKYFSSKPFSIKIDPSKSLRSIIVDLIEAAFARQRECQGTMIAGAVIQHLVGAKLEIALPNIQIEQKGFSVADAPGRRKGDFLVGDTSIHVTTAPSEALIRKCRDNLNENLRPVIITTQGGTGGASALAKDADVDDRIDILEVAQFIATNIYELSGFEHAKRPVKIRDLVNAYNRIIDQTETDPSLKIAIG
jgi:hypothetical protein